MDNFALEDWEWPPGAQRRYLIEPFQSDCLAKCGIPLTTICAVEWPNGASGGVLGASIFTSTLVFFRPEDVTSSVTPRAQRLTYLLGSVKPAAAQLAHLSIRQSAADIEKYFRSQVAPAQGAGKPFPGIRYFNIPEGVCLICHELGAWQGKEHRHLSTPFRVPEKLATLPSEVVLDWIGQQLGDSDSEPAFALRWNDWIAPQRAAYLDQIVPSLAERERLMHHIVASEPSINPAHTWRLTTRKARSQLSCTTAQAVATRPSPTVLARLDCWAELLRRTLPLPRLNSTSPLCVLQLYGVRVNSHMEGKTTTGHEQMEALMFLRDWARDKATAEEMEILFPSP